MAHRTYQQYCGLASALDIVGERWTALLIRDLAHGPRRFTELQRGLPGLSASLLSTRLRDLEDHGLLRRAAASREDGGGVRYHLTADGEDAAAALAPLTVWGAARLPETPPEPFDPSWLLFVLRACLQPDAVPRQHDVYEFRVAGASCWVEVIDGQAHLGTEPPREPDFTAIMPLPVLAALGTGRLRVGQAAASGDAEFLGDPEAGLRALRLFTPAPVGASA